MYGRLVECGDLKAGMRLAKTVVSGDVVLADEGALLTDPLIHLLCFLGVKRVAIEAPLAEKKSRALAARVG